MTTSTCGLPRTEPDESRLLRQEEGCRFRDHSCCIAKRYGENVTRDHCHVVCRRLGKCGSAEVHSDMPIALPGNMWGEKACSTAEVDENRSFPLRSGNEVSPSPRDPMADRKWPVWLPPRIPEILVLQRIVARPSWRALVKYAMPWIAPHGPIVSTTGRSLGYGIGPLLSPFKSSRFVQSLRHGFVRFGRRLQRKLAVPTLR